MGFQAAASGKLVVAGSARKAAEASLRAELSRVQTAGEAVDLADKADQKGFPLVASAAYKRAGDLVDNQRDALKVAQAAEMSRHPKAAKHIYDRVEGLPSTDPGTRAYLP